MSMSYILLYENQYAVSPSLGKLYHIKQGDLAASVRTNLVGYNVIIQKRRCVSNECMILVLQELCGN